MPRPPLYPSPKPAVLPVPLPGTSGTGPRAPASAEEPPPPCPVGFAGTVNPPALVTCASVIAVFAIDREASLWQATGVCSAFCATAPPGMSTTVRTNTERMEAPLVARAYDVLSQNLVGANDLVNDSRDLSCQPRGLRWSW